MKKNFILDDLFKKINLGPSETEVYLSLLKNGSTTAGNLAKKKNLPRSSLYGFLEKLAGKGLVKQSERHNTKVWQAESPEHISGMLDKKINDWELTKDNFLEILPELQNSQTKDVVTPCFNYFEGIEGVKHILKDGLLYRDIKTQSLWPIEIMMDLLGEDFFIYFNQQKIKQNIWIQALWPKNRSVDIKKYPFLGVGEEFKREIRLAPDNIDCSMGYWLYHNKVAFISSRKECFGFIMESGELHQMLLTQFNILWNMSKPIK